MKLRKYIQSTLSIIITIGISYWVIYAWSWLVASDWDSLTHTKWNELYTIVDSNSGNLVNISSSGSNIWIGTSSPESKLEVSGTIHSTSGGIKFPDNTIQTTATLTSGTFETQRLTGSTTNKASPVSHTCPAGWKLMSCTCSYTDTSTNFWPWYCRVLSDTQCWWTSWYGSTYNFEVTAICARVQ
jgi:hypothetical protein